MRGSSLVTLVAGIAIGVSVVAGGAMAMQDRPKLPELPKVPEMPKAPEMPKVPEMPKAPDMPAMPEMDEETKKMMEAWMKAGKLGKEHERLTKAVGTWKGVTTAQMFPGAPETTSEMTTVVTSLMGGRYTRGESTGTMDMGPMGKAPFEGLGHYGFNNAIGKYECTWMDNTGTMIMFLTGEASEDGKVITWKGEFMDPSTNSMTWMREVETLIDDNTMKLEFYSPDGQGGEFKMMTINYTRVAGGATPVAKPSR